MNKWRIYLLIACLFSLLCGCTQEKEYTIPPSGMMEVEGETYKIKVGNYRLAYKKGSMSVFEGTDAASPNQIEETLETIAVPKGSVLKIHIPNNPKLSISLWKDDKSGKAKKLKNNLWEASTATGRFIYEIKASWWYGEGSYPFVVEVN
ncbi:hypothetical protein [Bacillus sp. NPDC077027]|uniref:hypothetical protein n=1 Tax=Bacillus sp. NPDC077027 TaxID=3390548 RepID=UPI003D0859DB